MTPELRQTNDARPFLWLVIGMSVLTAVFLRSLPERIWVFSDTAHYLAVARSIQAGEGIQSDLVYYTEQALPGTIPAPQTVFPPGYPIAIATAATLTSSNPNGVAKWICLFSYVLIAPLTFLLGIELKLRPTVAASCGLFWLPLVSGWMPTWCYSSDIPFTMLTLLSMLSFVRATSWRGLLGAGLIAALAIAFRYTGVFLGFAYGIALVLRHRTKLRQLIKDGCLSIGPALVTALVMFARNRALVGSWQGGNETTQHTFARTLRLLYYSMSEFTGFSQTAFMKGRMHCLAQIVFGVAVFAAMGYAIFRSRKQVGTRWRNASVVVLFYGPLVIAMLVWLDMRNATGMTPRLLVPAVPSIILGLGVLLEYMMRQSRIRQGWPLAATMLGVFGVLAGQPACMTNYREFAARGLATRMILEEPIEQDQTLKDFLQANCDTSATLMSSMPQMTHLFVERPLVGLVSNVYNTNGKPWSFERTQEYVRRYRVRYILLLTHPDTREYGPVFFRRLSVGEQPEWLRLEHEGQHFKLFRTDLGMRGLNARH